ncbi:energy-coupling factor transporter transmembrane component T [Planococcus sp. N028]|uniref:Energy-coupling factor transporter transmembrane component T n=1 Tax=Planococcus shixiaomingii TaxID=3058393 RepID=A0ABT8MZU8_9BACL|nr:MULTISPECIES: energy-coupling factor transporter transmembrane component T [unclassified Planococcus (in: firmicutes)]MDN7240998.1 energy-coupling factor transporter transmembrane component T [Planococcus sp. N028]WKA53252.1 energy-coupling factor transporter transmembrane component T [Planococcus sp. N022]
MPLLLHDMNPSVKFIVVTVSMLAMAFFFDPWTPLLFLIGVFILQVFMSRVNWKLWCWMMLPFTFGAFGYFWTTLVFGASTDGTVLWTFAGIDVTEEKWRHALSLSFRVLAFSTLSLLFALTTDPVKFVMSLMQQLKLSPKLAYSIMVSYQFLPVLKDEFSQIQQAQRLRGVQDKKHWWQRLLQMRRLLLPMLAGAVRKAERAAFAMEARGFTGEPRTAFYRPVTLTKTDFLLSGVFMIVLVCSCVGGYLLNKSF